MTDLHGDCGDGLKVLIVDDHPIVVSGCRAMLAQIGSVEVFAAGDTKGGFAQYVAIAPDVAVIDINLPGASGFDLARRVLEYDPLAKIIVFSMNEDPIFAARAIEAGAKAYVTKNGDPEDFLAAVREVAAGGEFLPADIAKRLAFGRSPSGVNPLTSLTPREVEVLRLLGRGRKLSGIAHDIDISYKTVANSCAIIKGKLGARTTADLVRIAVEHDLT